eukprot:SAG22_NODE_1315_length_4769_cov_23.910064_2_plen_163_part_00
MVPPLVLSRPCPRRTPVAPPWRSPTARPPPPTPRAPQRSAAASRRAAAAGSPRVVHRAGGARDGCWERQPLGPSTAAKLPGYVQAARVVAAPLRHRAAVPPIPLLSSARPKVLALPATTFLLIQTSQIYIFKILLIQTHPDFTGQKKMSVRYHGVDTSSQNS